jgi:hypothetical protein
MKRIFSSESGKMAFTEDFLGRSKSTGIKIGDGIKIFSILAVAFLIASGLHRGLILAVLGGF